MAVVTLFICRSLLAGDSESPLANWPLNRLQAGSYIPAKVSVVALTKPLAGEVARAPALCLSGATATSPWSFSTLAEASFGYRILGK